MIKSGLLLIGLLFSSVLVHAQGGYMNQKNYFDISLMGNVPLTSGSFNQTEFKPSGDKMTETKDWLDYGFNFHYYRAMSKRFSMGIFFGAKEYQLSLPDYYTSNYATQEGGSSDTTYLRFESMKYRNFYFGPTFEFASGKGTSGVGFTYNFSVGASVSVLKNGNYAYSLNEFSNSGDDDRWTNTDYYRLGFDWENIYGVFLQTGFKMRYPLSDFLSFYTGFNYTVVVNYRPKSFTGNANSDIFNNEDIFFQLQRENMFTTSLSIGITFHL